MLLFLSMFPGCYTLAVVKTAKTVHDGAEWVKERERRKEEQKHKTDGFQRDAETQTSTPR